MQSISPQERPAPRWLAGALIGLCTAQPLLDVLSFWTQTLGRATSVSLALRMLLLAAATVLAFVLSERKRAYLILCGVLALFWGAHVLACRRVGYAAPMSDLINFIRVAQLPVYTFALITLFRRTPHFLDVLEDACTINLYLIALITLVSVVTGTSMPTYAKFHIGWSGWFWLPNSQSAVLGVLTVISLLAAVRRKKLTAAALRCVVGFALLFVLGHAASLCRDLRHCRRRVREHGADPAVERARAGRRASVCRFVRRALSPEPHVPQPAGLCRERERAAAVGR